MIEYGYCYCGCGEKTTLAPCSNTNKGWIKGEPVKYIASHRNRIPLENYYEVRDMGYKTPCWIWKLAPSNGYGRMIRGRIRKFAHVFFYELKNGTVPSGFHLDHLCRVRGCINPDHLEPVTQAVNTQRGSSAKLNENAVLEIRRLKSETHMTNREIGEMFGVYEWTISMIANGRMWKNVGGQP